MSARMAFDYAEAIAAEIRANVESGYPFGLVSDDNPVTDRENGEEVSGMDYLSDALDFTFHVTSDREYRSGIVHIAMGGPSAWIDTDDRSLYAAWWSETVRVPLPSAFCGALDEALKEYWNMGA